MLAEGRKHDKERSAFHFVVLSVFQLNRNEGESGRATVDFAPVHAVNFLQFTLELIGQKQIELIVRINWKTHKK